jgi:hypothetical protein
MQEKKDFSVKNYTVLSSATIPREIAACACICAIFAARLNPLCAALVRFTPNCPGKVKPGWRPQISKKYRHPQKN